MIQRVQSIFLAISVLIGLALLFLPLAEVQTGVSTYIIKGTGIFYSDAGTHIFEGAYLALSAVLTFHLLLTIASIFQYKNRPMQINLCAFNILLLAVFSGLILFADYVIPARIIESEDFSVSYMMASLLPVLSMVFLFLAIRGIKKDDKLLKSIDRIR